MSDSIEIRLRKLKLSGLTKEWRNIPFQSNEQYLSALLDLELQARDANRINRFIRTAGFGVLKTLEDFTWSKTIALPTGLTQSYMEELLFIPKRENLIFMGSVGTGKTHLATALALRACEQGKKARFFTAASLANLLLERNQKGTLNSFISSLKQLQLLVVVRNWLYPATQRGC